MKKAILKIRKKYGRNSFIGSLCDMLLNIPDETRYTDTKLYSGTYRHGERMEKTHVIHSI